jgi:hypothetical protein
VFSGQNKWGGKPPVGSRLNRHHPFARNAELVVLCNEALLSSIDLVQSVTPTLNGTMPVSHIPFMGWSLYVENTTDQLQYSGKPTTSDRDLTLACVARWRSSGTASRRIVTQDADEGVAGGFSLCMSSTAELANVVGTLAVESSGLAVTLNEPYFAMFSRRNGDKQYNWVLRNMASGLITSAETTGVQEGGTGLPGVYSIAATVGTVRDFDVSAVWVLGEYLPMSACVRFAANPWEMFIPQRNTVRYIEALAAAGHAHRKANPAIVKSKLYGLAA